MQIKKVIRGKFAEGIRRLFALGVWKEMAKWEFPDKYPLDLSNSELDQLAYKHGYESFTSAWRGIHRGELTLEALNPALANAGKTFSDLQVAVPSFQDMAVVGYVFAWAYIKKNRLPANAINYVEDYLYRRCLEENPNAKHALDPKNFLILLYTYKSDLGAFHPQNRRMEWKRRIARDAQASLAREVPEFFPPGGENVSLDDFIRDAEELWATCAPSLTNVFSAFPKKTMEVR